MQQFFRTKLFLGLLLFLFVFSSCKKEDPVPIYDQKAQLLAGSKGQSKNWKLTSYSLTLPNGDFLDVFEAEDLGFKATCTRDDIYKFSNNPTQSYESNEGATKCSDTDPALIEKGTWFFSNDAMWINISPDIVNSESYGLFTKLFYDGDFLGLGVVAGKINELTENNMRVEFTYSNGTQTLKVNLIFTKA
jgi:hypothetical protein